ncbi:hypothetical protein B1H58_17425 [Pantoea alhagi]|uniref:Barstar (barnase inhibitor) domain-containing protein n=2 Tax=Erwiniaceae TaxID=1903409 RepID=A0A1W6B998_9GAMM|nr:hypothetical protein B1H58_17425 [Pantoea alhagi]
MLEMHFDFLAIRSGEEFYRCFTEQSGIAGKPGASIDALWDMLTGELRLPARAWLYHLPSVQQRADLAAIIELLEEAARELQGEFIVQRVQVCG